MSKSVDHTGRTFGRLTATERLARKGQRTRYRCSCECGNELVVAGDSLTSGNTRSCGCLYDSAERGRNISAAKVKHGARTSDADPGTYGAYISRKDMIARTTDKNSDSFHHYGGKGITVCAEWLDSFEQFLEDMGPRPLGHSIERKDNTLGYCKENCEWADPVKQSNNRSTNLRITFNGRTKTGAEWMRELAMPRNTMYKRLEAGWSVEKALTTPLRKRAPNKVVAMSSLNVSLFGMSPFTAALLASELAQPRNSLCTGAP